MTRASRQLLGLASIFALIAASILVVIPSAQAATTGATGNAKAIAYFRTVVKATDATSVRELDEIITGYFAVKEIVRGNATYVWFFQEPTLTPGYDPASDTAEVLVRRGKVVEMFDELIPYYCTLTKTSPCEPIEVFVNSAGSFYRLQPSPTSDECVLRTSSTFQRVSDNVGDSAGVTLLGDYAPIRRTFGNTDNVTSTYSYGKQLVTQVYTINRTTRLPIVEIASAAATPGHAAIKVSWTYHYLSKSIMGTGIPPLCK